MNKFIIYGILLLIYLGLSKGFSPSTSGISYINNNDKLSELITGAPVEVILVDIHTTGFIIKTYYHKYKVIYGFQSFEEVIVRTSRKFSDELIPYLGMSIFRRDKEASEDFTPLPPGALFIGNNNFGVWNKHPSGDKVWKFFRAYRQLPNYLGWRDFKPTYDLYTKIQIHQENKTPLHGLHNEFGLKGKITQAVYPQYFERQKPKDNEVKQFLKNYLNENFIH